NQMAQANHSLGTKNNSPSSLCRLKSSIQAVIEVVLVISTTEQQAALPYQGSGHWRPKMRSASMMRAIRGQTVQEMIECSTVAEWRVSSIRGLALDQQVAPNIVKLTVPSAWSAQCGLRPDGTSASDGSAPSPPFGSRGPSNSSARSGPSWSTLLIAARR